MKTWKIFPGICLALLLIAGLTPAAFAALVTSDAQAIHLVGNSDPGDVTGILAFSKLSQIKPDGTTQPFVFPPDKTLVVTWLNVNVKAVDTSLVTNADLRVGPFFSRVIGMNNGNAGFTDGLDPGVLINASGYSNNIYGRFYSVNLKNDVIIQGTVNVRLMGYLVSF